MANDGINPSIPKLNLSSARLSQHNSNTTPMTGRMQSHTAGVNNRVRAEEVKQAENRLRMIE
jgi:hypothetical protein